MDGNSLAKLSPTKRPDFQRLRLHVLQALSRVQDGASLSVVLPDLMVQLDASQRAQGQAWLMAAIRSAPRFQWLLERYMDKPIRRKDRIVHTLLLLGLSQCEAADTVAAKIVNETVALLPALKKNWAKGVVNGLLRRYLREQEALQEEDDPVWRYAHPQWLIDALQQAWPEQWVDILTENNLQPPLSLRVNLSQVSPDAVMAEFDRAGVGCSQLADAAIQVEVEGDITHLPGFEQGWWAVQDVAAQQAAYLMDVQPGMRVLDACAAPGGKTAHLADVMNNQGELVALDVNEERLNRVKENLQRLQLQATLLNGDAGKPAEWWDNKPFDRILLDAPCSATGVIRRHPDIKLHRLKSDLDELVRIQQQLLESLWSVLAPGGMLVYASCSVLPQENTQQIEEFIRNHEDAEEKSLTVSWGMACQYGRQVFPGRQGMDGFYYACLLKQQS